MLFAVEIHVLVAVAFGVVALLLALTMLGIWSMSRRDEPPRLLEKTASPSHGQPIPARRLPETQTSTDERSMEDSDSDVAIVVNQATPDLATSFLDGELAAEDETIETVDLHDVISEDDEELAELRLTLDASQTELTHLTASRDQALTIVANHDQLIEQLRQRAVDQDAENESLQQQNQSLVAQVGDIEQQSASLATELAQTRAELEAASQQLAQHEHAANESIPQNEAQQQATIDEFRVVLTKLL